jgi:hypothetical protein
MPLPSTSDPTPNTAQATEKLLRPIGPQVVGCPRKNETPFAFCIPLSCVRKVGSEGEKMAYYYFPGLTREMRDQVRVEAEKRGLSYELLLSALVFRVRIKKAKKFVLVPRGIGKL